MYSVFGIKYNGVFSVFIFPHERKVFDNRHLVFSWLISQGFPHPGPAHGSGHGYAFPVLTTPSLHTSGKEQQQQKTLMKSYTQGEETCFWISSETAPVSFSTLLPAFNIPHLWNLSHINSHSFAPVEQSLLGKQLKEEASARSPKFLSFPPPGHSTHLPKQVHPCKNVSVIYRANKLLSLESETPHYDAYVDFFYYLTLIFLILTL